MRDNLAGMTPQGPRSGAQRPHVVFDMTFPDRNLGGSGHYARSLLSALRRCEACFAVYRPAKVCPRCGLESKTNAKPLPRVLTQDEKDALVAYLLTL